MLLFAPCKLGPTELRNPIVMAPMTRSRASEGAIANAMMAEYYAQRASAGLIITEGTSPSPNGIGYPRIPALYNADHVLGWSLVTSAVHSEQGKIFIQLMHTGRVSAQPNLPEGGRVLGPVAETCPGEMYTDSKGMQPHTPPQAMTERDIADTVAEFAHAATLAMEAGFDGIELHAANGYLMEQFLNANVNKRTDVYGGSAAGRNRFVLEVAQAAIKAIGGNRVGIRVSPYGVFNSTGAYAGMEEQYLELAEALSDMGLVYLHLVDHSAMGAPPVPKEFKDSLRRAFKGSFIASGGLDRASAEKVLDDGDADLVAFGRPFISNPDLVYRLKTGAALAAPDASTFYTPGAKGYTDYPTLAG